jgi:integrase
MASISTEGTNGIRIIQFIGSDKKRRSIRLGKMSQKTAESVLSRIENLIAAKRSHTAIDADTANWLSKIDDVLRSRVAAVGLCEESNRITLGRFLDEFLAENANKPANTVKNYKQWSKYLLTEFGRNMQLNELSRVCAEQWANRLYDKYAEATAARALKFARQIYHLARKRKHVTESPFDEVHIGSMVNTKTQAYITREDMTKIMSETRDNDWRVILVLVRYAGLRHPSETTLLRWEDVDWARDRFRVTSPKTKSHGKAERYAPLLPEITCVLRPIFDALPTTARTTATVLTTHLDTEKNMRKPFCDLCQRVGIVPPPKPFVNLRASAERDLLDRFPIAVVASWLGHSPEIALRHYTRVTDEDFRRAAGRTDNRTDTRADHAKASASPMQNQGQPMTGEREATPPEGA